MAFSMEAARLAANRTVCDVCGAHSSRPRGASCRTCLVGTLRYVTELQVLRAERSQARRAAAEPRP